MELPPIAAPIVAQDSRVSSETDVDPLRESAEQFEATFVKQMLQYAGLDDAFGGGDGAAAAAFSSFALDRIAESIAEQGSFGLADQFYNALASSEEQAPTESFTL